MQTGAAQLEWSQALFPARHRRKVEEAGGLFIEWPQHKYAHSLVPHGTDRPKRYRT